MLPAPVRDCARCCGLPSGCGGGSQLLRSLGHGLRFEGGFVGRRAVLLHEPGNLESYR